MAAAFDTSATDNFLNSLDGDEIETLVELVARIDPLVIEGGAPKYSEDEINLVGRFRDFAQGIKTDEGAN